MWTLVRVSKARDPANSLGHRRSLSELKGFAIRVGRFDLSQKSRRYAGRGKQQCPCDLQYGFVEASVAYPSLNRENRHSFAIGVL